MPLPSSNHGLPLQCCCSMMPLRILGFLMLMLLQCDADSSCPDGVLSVTSSEVIAKFGSTISLNCSKEDNDHYGIYWLNGNTVLVEEEERASVELDWTLSDWNVRPQCKLAQNESASCTKDLEITVYKNPEYVTVYPINHGNNIVEGTQHKLQCDIIEVTPIQNLTVKWYKGHEIIHEEHFTNTSTTPVSESSILTLNISRKDHGAEIRCEAQLDFGLGGPNTSVLFHTHRVSVHYPPALSSGPLQFLNKEEGDSVTLICDAEGRPSPHFHWVQNGVNMTEDTASLFVNVSDVDTVYTCTATNNLGRITKEFHVNVTKVAMSAPAKSEGCPLTLSPAELVVKLGDPASVNCSTSVANPGRLGWEAPKGGSGSEGSTIIIWSVDEVEFWNTVPMCYITTRENEQCDEPLAMTVYKTPEIITDFPRGLVKEEEDRELKCDFINVAPVQNLTVRWYRGNESIMRETFDGEGVRPVNRSSTLRVRHERGNNGEKFRCSAELHLGPNGPNPIPTVTSEPYVANVNYKPQVKNCLNHYAGGEHNFTLDIIHCEADGNPSPKVQWFHQGELVNLSQPLTRDQSGRYRVDFSNNLGNTTHYVDITVEYGPSFSCDGPYKVKENDKFQISCKPVGNPVPTITWFKDGKEVNRQHWSKHDSGKYVLKANNSYGTASHEVEVDVMYKPQVKNCLNHYAGGEHNLTLDMIHCEADGNPSPKVQWFHQGELVNLSQPLTRDQSGRYRVDFSNNLGSTTHYVDITVEYGPSFSCDGPYKVKENDKFQISCKPVGNPVPTITWFKDGKEVNRKHWTKHDSGKYVLKANNSYGTASHEVEVDVMYKPQVKNCLNHYAGGEHNLTLDMIHCEADGNPSPKVQWFHQGELVNLSQPLTRDQSGRYRVDFSNNLGNTTHYVDITVEYGPSFSCDGPYKVKENDKFQISCIPVGNPVPTITWFKDGKEVNRQHWTKHDSGKYVLKANNSHGTASHEVEVDVMQNSFPWWLCLLIALIVIFIIICLIWRFCYNHQKKHGRYDFVPDKCKDDIAMTTQTAA